MDANDLSAPFDNGRIGLIQGEPVRKGKARTDVERYVAFLPPFAPPVAVSEIRTQRDVDLIPGHCDGSPRRGSDNA